MYQKLIVVGNLGTDPEQREVGGTTVTNFTLASNRKWTGKDGVKQEETTWFRVSVWGKQGDAVATYMSKGRQVLVEGRLNPDAETGGPKLWTDKNGAPRASYDLTAETVRFLSGGDSSASASAQQDDEDDFPF